jgi:cytochrome c1
MEIGAFLAELRFEHKVLGVIVLIYLILVIITLWNMDKLPQETGY